MKEQIEEAIVEFSETLSYKGEGIVDSFMRGHSDKPDGLSTMIIDLNHPAERVRIRNRVNKEVEATGLIYFIFKKENGEDTLEDAEERNDKIPEYVFDQILKDETLGGRIDGAVTPKTLKGGLYELKNTEGLFFYMSEMTFEYKGAWISPDLS